MRATRVAVLIGIALPALAIAQETAQTGPDVVVVGVRPSKDVVVVAPLHCYRRSGDPLDAVPVHRCVTQQRVIALDSSGHMAWQRDREPVTGPGVWQRAGNAIGDYRFRVPPDEGPLCIGALLDSPNGYGQLRQIIDVSNMKGRYVHFSALVATREAELVRFWLALGDKTNTRSIGGDTHNYPIRGTHGWQRIDLLVGPVPSYANHASYGFLLYGGGDVWLTNPKVELLTRDEVNSAARAIRVTPVDRLLPYGER